jgi:predicted Zn-dependent protease
MTDIKVRLKRIKELIEGQEWQKAWDISERILSEDPNNLPARLFMGKAAMELDKPERAIECFRSVAKTQPDQIAAWQGVIVFYAKYKQVAEQSDELTEAYRRCLDHLGNDEKLKPKIIEYLLGYCRQLTLKGN